MIRFTVHQVFTLFGKFSTDLKANRPTLFSCAWKDSRCRIGLILGTGTNACYLEDIKNIETLDPAQFPGQEHMVINTEWGAFGDNGELDFVRTKWDRAVDEMSVNPGKQIFEKMISG